MALEDPQGQHMISCAHSASRRCCAGLWGMSLCWQFGNHCLFQHCRVCTSSCPHAQCQSPTAHQPRVICWTLGHLPLKICWWPEIVSHSIWKKNGLIFTEIHDFSFPFTVEFSSGNFLSSALTNPSPRQSPGNIFSELTLRKCNIHLIKSLDFFLTGLGFTCVCPVACASNDPNQGIF